MQGLVHSRGSHQLRFCLYLKEPPLLGLLEQSRIDGGLDCPHFISCQTVQRLIVCKDSSGHEHKPTVFLRHPHFTNPLSATTSASRFPADHLSVEKTRLVSWPGTGAAGFFTARAPLSV